MTNDKQGDLFYSVGQRGKLSAKTNAVEKKEEDVGGKNEDEWTGKVQIRTRRKLLAVIKACMAIF